MTDPLPFISGSIPGNPGPLARYLPPVPEGVASGWLEGRLPAGSWVLDPFGASPRMAVEAARAGYRVLVAAHNPVARFLLEMTAAPPAESDLRAALAELASAHKGDPRTGGERIEPHLRALYNTECARCGRMVSAEAFLWEKQAETPFARLYKCPYCGDGGAQSAGERPATQGDAARAAAFTASGLHRARALERVAPVNDPDREHAEEALAVYLPRTVYALFTLINRLDGLPLTPARRNCLMALMLTACDQANVLWQYPSGRERPRQLSAPPRFRENNVWLALESGIAQWTSAAAPVPVTTWPQTPPESGGVCIFEGRLKDLAAALPSVGIGAVLAAMPRPNQAFWTLSALWAGWLWGREAVGPFKSVLRRRRYDWAWHTTALNAALGHLAPQILPATPFFASISEVEPGFLTAALVAADAAGFDLCSLALRGETGQAQILWERSAQLAREPVTMSAVTAASQASAARFLRACGEPAGYLPMFAAALSGTAEVHAFQRPAALQTPDGQDNGEPKPAEDYNQAQNAAREALTYRGGFLRYGVDDSPESGQWWVREPVEPVQPLADRVEMALVNYLNKHPGCTLAELDCMLCAAFPGLLTPSVELIHTCLSSYGEPDPVDEHRWRLRQQDFPAARRADLAEVRIQLDQLGKRLNFKVVDDTPLVWVDALGQAAYRFYPIASAVLGEILIRSGSPPGNSLIVLPGSRANLVAFKLGHDLRLAQAAQSGWRFLKFRHVRWLLEAPMLSLENLDENLVLDPLTYTASQMRLL